MSLRKFLPIVLLILAGTPGRAGGQTSVSVAGGVAIPLGDAADVLKAGYNASLALTAKPPLASVGLRLEGMFNSLNFSDRSTGNRTQRIIAATANATLSDPATPLRSFYLIGGMGYYQTKTIGGVSLKGNNDIGFNAGAGIFLTSAVGTFLEVRYHHIPSEAGTTSLVPVTFGLRF